MNLISISELKKLNVEEIKARVPFQVTADGRVVAVMQMDFKPPEFSKRTQCPNCKMEYDVTPPDGRPGFFTMKHPKG